MGQLVLQPGAGAVDGNVGENTPDTPLGVGVNYSLVGFAGIRGRALLKFDLSGLPAGATITGATLSLFGLGGGVSTTLVIHRVLAADSGWVHAATWNFADGAALRWVGDVGANGGTDAGCSIAGTDYAAATMGTMAFVATAGVESQAVLDLPEFLLMCTNNYGLYIRTSTGIAATAQPGSIANATAGRRPKLVVDYTVPVSASHQMSGGIDGRMSGGLVE